MIIIHIYIYIDVYIYISTWNLMGIPLGNTGRNTGNCRRLIHIFSTIGMVSYWSTTIFSGGRGYAVPRGVVYFRISQVNGEHLQ